MKKGSMELEYVAKMMILVVAVGVIISIMYYLYEKSKSIDYVIPEQDNTLSGGIEVSLEGISADTLKDYIQACYTKNYKNNHDMLCYLINLNTPAQKAQLQEALNNNDFSFPVILDENTPSNVNLIIISYRFEDGAIYIKGR